MKLLLRSSLVNSIKVPSVIEQITTRNLVPTIPLHDSAVAIESERHANDFVCATTPTGTHYHHYGSTKVGKLPLILLHPLAGNSSNWIEIIELLRGNSDVYALDLPNHGESSYLMETASTESYNEWLETTLNELKLKRIHLAGLSLGGRIAAYFADTRSERLGSLILFAPALNPAFKSLTLNDDLLIRGAIDLGAQTLIRFSVWNILKSIVATEDPQKRMVLRYAFESLIIDQERRSYGGLMMNIDWIKLDDGSSIDWQRIASQVPVSVYYGSADGYCPSQRSLIPSIDGIMIEEVKAVGHLLPFEDPNYTVEIIKSIIG